MRPGTFGGQARIYYWQSETNKQDEGVTMTRANHLCFGTRGDKGAIQICVKPVVGEEFGMCTALDDSSIFENQDLVGMTDCA